MFNLTYEDIAEKQRLGFDNRRHARTGQIDYTRALAAASHNVRALVGTRDRVLLEKSAEASRQNGANAEFFVADVSDEREVRTLRDQVASQCGDIEILINNAGINIRKPSEEFYNWKNGIGFLTRI